jgi:hypothetical protein
VKAASGRLFHQGARLPSLACRSSAPLLRFVAEQRLYRVGTNVARALVAWGDGFPAVLLVSVPQPGYVLELQAQARRCVSLLPRDASTSPQTDALAFALHDLRHLDKFVDPSHHLGQVGFFASLHTSSIQPAWHRFEGEFDETFRRDWHHVAADMNGSAVFLFAALKMKLKMAVRRALSPHPPTDGPLTPVEARTYESALDHLLGLLDFEPAILEAARATSAKRDDPASALQLLHYFEARGRGVLASRRAGLKFD